MVLPMGNAFGKEHLAKIFRFLKEMAFLFQVEMVFLSDLLVQYGHEIRVSNLVCMLNFN